MTHPVCVIGAGSWGTALAMVLSRTGRPVYLLTRTPEIEQQLQAARENSDYLPGIRFPDSLMITADWDAAVAQAPAVVLALPCSAAEEVLPKLSNLNMPVIGACKGIDADTLERTDELLLRHVGPERTALLSGPSFAKDVAMGLPTAITMAAGTQQLAEEAATFFDDGNFRIYTSTDLAGVALGGALKNVIAIAAGIADGLNLGHSAVAALVTRGITEMTRLAVACGGRPETLAGLSGLGDLVLTCTGDLSRNRKMGRAMAQGMTPDEARAHVEQVVEGEKTAFAACKLAEKYGVEMPIAAAVRSVLLSEMTPVDAVRRLLSRPEKSE